MLKLIDANVILRYILNDVPDMNRQAGAVIDAGAYTTPEVLAEVVYVLTKMYDTSREDVAECLFSLLDEVDIEHPEVYDEALELYAGSKLDFVDCILIARHRTLGDEVFSFDKKLNKQLDRA